MSFLLFAFNFLTVLASASEFQFSSPKIHCGGCANAIEDALGKDARIQNVRVDTDTKIVLFETKSDWQATESDIKALMKNSHYTVEKFKLAPAVKTKK